MSAPVGSGTTPGRDTRTNRVTALYLSFALLAAQRIERVWLRRLVIVVCAVIPFLVAYARLYRGMHHLSDVLIGALNGIACALLAWTCLRTHRRSAAATRHLTR